MSWSTSELRARLAPWNWVKPSSKIFYWPFQGGSSFVDLLCLCSVLCLLCLWARLFMCFVVTCWERADLLALVCGVYEDCSNMNASSFITFFTYMLRQNAIPFWKELFIACKLTPNIKKHSLYLSSYRPLYKGHSCILKLFWSKLQSTFWYMCGHSVISL